MFNGVEAGTVVANALYHTIKKKIIIMVCRGVRVLSCMTCVVNFVFALSQLQGVEWGWPGRREPNDEHSPAS